MASISMHKTTTGENRWRVRIRLRGQAISKTFHRRTMALKWARMVEMKLVEMHDYDPSGTYKLIRID